MASRLSSVRPYWYQCRKEADARMEALVLEESTLQHSLTVAADGNEALAFLHQDPPFTGLPLPDLVLLDLNLPKVDGIAVLQAIKNLLVMAGLLGL